MDGGTTWNVNISSAIEGCMGIVDGDQTKIVVDILMCSEHSIAPYTPGTSIDNLLRRRQISKYYSGRDAIQAVMRAYPDVNWRYLIEEKNSLGGLGELNFNNENTWPLQLQGREQAQEVLDFGPGYGFDTFAGAK